MIENFRNFLYSRFSAKQINTAANIVMFAGVAINTIEILNNPGSWNWPVNISAIALVVVGAVFQAMFVRCPACGDKLKGKANKMMDRCPNCDHDLTKLAK